MDTNFAESKDSGMEVVGVDRAGNEIVRRIKTGEDVMSVEGNLRAEGGRVFLARRIARERRWPKGTSAEEFARFNEMLAASVKRGIPMLDGVRDVARGMGRARFRESLARVEENLAAGASLKDAFAKESSDFPPLYGRLLEAGAAAGNLSDVLLALSRSIRTDATFRRGVIEACVYPVVLLFAAVVFLTTFSVSLYPAFSSTAASLPMKMPIIARLMTGQSRATFVLLGFLGVLVCAALIWWGGMKDTAGARRFIRKVVPGIPLYGLLYESAIWSTAADTLALLMRAEMTVPSALNLVGGAIDCHWVHDAFECMAEDVTDGLSLSDAARDAWNVPLPVIRALDSGEAKNDVPGALENLAEDYRRRAGRRAQAIVRYLPATFALVLGVFILLTALTVFGPYIRFWGAAW